MPPSVIPINTRRAPPSNLADLVGPLGSLEHAQAPLPAPLAPPDSDSEGETPPVVVAARQRRDVVLLIALVIAVPSVFLLVLAAGLIYHYTSPRPRTKPPRPAKTHASGTDTDCSEDLANPPPYDGDAKLPPCDADAAEKVRAPPKRVWYEKPGVVPYGAAVTVFPVSLDVVMSGESEKEWEKSKAKEKEAEAEADHDTPRHLSSPLMLPPTLPASPAYTFRPDPGTEAHEPPQPPCSCTEPTCPGGALAFASGPRRRHTHVAETDEWSDSTTGGEEVVKKPVKVSGPPRTPSCACDEPSCPGGEIAAAGLRRRRRLGRPWWRRVFD